MSKKQSYYVRGTTCQSCEVVIERELKKLEGVEDVSVSHATQELAVDVAEKGSVSESEIASVIGRHGYTLAKKPQKHRKRQSINWGRVGGYVVVVAALYWLFDLIGLLRFSPTSAEPAGLLAIFGIGLVASVSSCTAVVGGLVAAVSTKMAVSHEGMSVKEKFRPHLYFNVGRVAGFFLLGALVGSLGAVLQLGPRANGVFIVAVAGLMVVLGVNLVELFPAPVVGMPKWLAHKVHDMAESRHPVAPMLLGAATFFLPCGFTQSMQLFALSLQNPIQAGMVMAVFALGTTPALLGIGRLTSVFQGRKLKEITYMAGVLVLVLGLSNLVNGATLLGVNLSFSSGANEAASSSVITGASQQIRMTVTPYGVYDPNILSVKKGMPVEWQIQGSDFMGCADTLVMPVFGVNTRLNAGANVVRFTPTKSGRFTFSCSMGMVRGTMVVTE